MGKACSVKKELVESPVKGGILKKNSGGPLLDSELLMPDSPIAHPFFSLPSMTHRFAEGFSFS